MKLKPLLTSPEVMTISSGGHYKLQKIDVNFNSLLCLLHIKVSFHLATNYVNAVDIFLYPLHSIRSEIDLKKQSTGPP